MPYKIVDSSVASSFGSTFGDFEDEIWKDFGTLARLMPSAVVRRGDNMPWLELDFLKYSTGTPSDDISDPYQEISADPYISPIDPYASVVVTPGMFAVREYSYREINPRVGLHIRWRKKIQEPRAFSFYLRDRRFRSLADLRDDINKRVGRFGINASALVKNPELRDQRTLVAVPKTPILYTQDSESPASPFDPYEPRSQGFEQTADPYFPEDPYLPPQPTIGQVLRPPASLTGSVDITDSSPSTSSQMVVSLRPFGGKRPQVVDATPTNVRAVLHDPAGKVSPPKGWSWSQENVHGVIGRVLRRNLETLPGVPVLPDLSQGMTWKQLSQDVWYPSANGQVPMPAEKPRERSDG